MIKSEIGETCMEDRRNRFKINSEEKRQLRREKGQRRRSYQNEP
jgi:hypothetical protein